MKEFLLEKYVKFWHWKFKLMNVNWQKSDLYRIGEYDNIPYENFESFLNVFSIDTDFWKEHWIFVLEIVLRQAYIAILVKIAIVYPQYISLVIIMLILLFQKERK